MSNTVRSNQIHRNFSSSWVEYFLRIAIAFFFIPYITTVLGEERYGVWVIVFQMVTYFTLFDFGIERALLRFTAKFHSQSNYSKLNRLLNTAFLFYLIVGTVIIVTGILAAIFLFDLIRTDSAAALIEGRNALIIASVYLGIRFYLLPFAGLLSGLQRHDIANILQMVEEIVRAALLVFLLWNGFGLTALALAILGASLARQVASIVIVRRLFPEIKFQIRDADRESGRMIYEFSRTAFGVSLAWLIIFNSDPVLLGLLGSASAAGIFAPGAQLVLYIRNLMNVIAPPLTALVSHLEDQGSDASIQDVYLKALRYSSFLTGLLCTGVVIWAAPLVHLWLSPEFAPVANVMVILSIGTAFFAPQIPGNAILFGLSKQRYILIVLVIEAVLKLGLALLLVRQYGMIGMAVAATVPQVLLYSTVYPLLIGRVLSLSYLRIMMTLLKPLLIATISTSLTGILLLYLFDETSWLGFLAGIILNGAIVLSLGYGILDKDERKKLIDLFKRDSKPVSN